MNYPKSNAKTTIRTPLNQADRKGTIVIPDPSGSSTSKAQP
jgi:hypothetical protein